MKIDSKTLATALDKVAHMATRRTSLPVLNCVKMSAEWGLLSISATDLECYAIVKCECDGDLAPCCVNAATILSLAKRGGGESELSHDGKRLLFKCGSTATLPVFAGEEFPPLKASKTAVLGVPVTDLIEALELAGWASDAKNAMAMWRAVVSITLEPKLMLVRSGDGKIFSQFSRALLCGKASVTLPCQHVPAVVHALNEPGCVVKLSENDLICESDNYTIAVRLVDEKYPDTRTFVDVERNPIGELEVQPLIDALEGCVIVAPDKAFVSVRIAAKDGLLSIDFQSPDTEYHASVPCAVMVEPFQLNAVLLLRMLEKVTEPKARFSVEKTSLRIDFLDCVFLVALLNTHK